MAHVHSKGCGCKELATNEFSQSLYKYINRDGIICLNESVLGSGPKIFKPHDVSGFYYTLNA